MTDTPPAWDPLQYSRFERERDRAAHDLLARLPGGLSPRDIWDLGCGAGQHAVELRRRYPGAAVHGLEPSEAMLDAARAREPAIDRRVGAIPAGGARGAGDLMFANASLHWLPDHEALLRRLTAGLAPRGVIACRCRWRTRRGAMA